MDHLQLFLIPMKSAKYHTIFYCRSSKNALNTVYHGYSKVTSIYSQKSSLTNSYPSENMLLANKKDHKALKAMWSI